MNSGIERKGVVREGDKTAFTVECTVHFKNGRCGRKRMCKGGIPAPPTVEPGKIPRISRLIALAIRFDRLLRQGLVRDYTDLARLGLVSKPRVTQIMNLLLLAPDIQEEILFLPRTSSGRDPISERHVRPITKVLEWDKQRMMWRDLKNDLSSV
jgi:hypothetical protein